MPNRNILAAALAALLLLTAGCSMIPEYKQPDLPVAAAWPGGETNQAQDTATSETVAVVSAPDIAWQTYFESEPLRKLIARALEQNRDLRVALLNIDRARAAFQIQEADSLPVISGGTSLTRQGVPADISATGSSYTASTLTASVGLTAYELDFFGRVKSLNQEALEAYLATEKAALNTRIVLIAQTADAYLTYLAEKKLLSLAKETCKSQEETYAVIKGRYEVGSATRLDLAQAATSVESAKVSITRYTRLTAQAKNAVTLLAGTSVGDILDTGETIDQVRLMDRLPTDLPSNVLLKRPDIRDAEHMLKAANADIGAARAALYPTISLTGSFGLASDDLSSLFKSGAASAWNFAPSLSIPIFSRGKLKASLEEAKVSEKIAAAEYETAVQTAFKEVADQLAARKTYQEQMRAQNALVDETRITYTLSRARYQTGIDDFLTVLDSQRSLFSAEQSAITVRQAYLSNLVNLYKVLGGGQI